MCKMPAECINLNKDISASFSAVPSHPPENASPPLNSKVEHARAESLPSSQKPESKPATFRATQFHTDMYRNNLLERVFLLAFLRNTAFGSPSQLI